MERTNEVQEKLQLVSIREVAEMLGKSADTVKYIYMKERVYNFPKAFPLGRKYMFRLDEINQWILDRQEAFNSLSQAEKADMMKTHDGISRFNRAVAEGRRIHARQKHKRVKEKNV